MIHVLFGSNNELRVIFTNITICQDCVDVWENKAKIKNTNKYIYIQNKKCLSVKLYIGMRFIQSVLYMLVSVNIVAVFFIRVLFCCS